MDESIAATKSADKKEIQAARTRSRVATSSDFIGVVPRVHKN